MKTASSGDTLNAVVSSDFKIIFKKPNLFQRVREKILRFLYPWGWGGERPRLLEQIAGLKTARREQIAQQIHDSELLIGARQEIMRLRGEKADLQAIIEQLQAENRELAQIASGLLDKKGESCHS